MVVFCYLERDNDKIHKNQSSYINHSSHFQISPFLSKRQAPGVLIIENKGFTPASCKFICTFNLHVDNL